MLKGECCTIAKHIAESMPQGASVCRRARGVSGNRALRRTRAFATACARNGVSNARRRGGHVILAWVRCYSSIPPMNVVLVRDTDADRRRQTQTDADRRTQIVKRVRHRKMQIDRERERERDRQTDRQTQTDKQIQTDTDRHKSCWQHTSPCQSQRCVDK
jgi:hypothetical protein